MKHISLSTLTALLLASFTALQAAEQPLKDKTLVVWAAPADLDQCGKSIIIWFFYGAR